MIRYFLSECQDNVNSFNNNRENIKLESEANPYHPNEGTNRIIHWVDFSFLSMKEI